MQTASGQNSTLTFANLASNVLNGGSTLTFEATGNGDNFGTAANTVLFTTPPTLTPATTGILAALLVGAAIKLKLMGGPQ